MVLTVACPLSEDGGWWRLVCGVCCVACGVCCFVVVSCFVVVCCVSLISAVLQRIAQTMARMSPNVRPLHTVVLSPRVINTRDTSSAVPFHVSQFFSPRNHLSRDKSDKTLSLNRRTFLLSATALHM